MWKLRYFWRELSKGFSPFWELALFVIATGIISYGVAILIVYAQTKILALGTNDMVSTSMAIIAAIILAVGFVYALITAVIKTVKRGFFSSEEVSQKNI
jgi:hypothetical protein